MITHGTHREYRFRIALEPHMARADVDVFAPCGAHYAFELGVINRAPKGLERRLTSTVQAWIDGTISRHA